MELRTNCTIDMGDANIDIEASTVSGIVTLNHEQEMTNSSCNQTKEVIIYNGESSELFVDSFIMNNHSKYYCSFHPLMLRLYKFNILLQTTNIFHDQGTLLCIKDGTFRSVDLLQLLQL